MADRCGEQPRVGYLPMTQKTARAVTNNLFKAEVQHKKSVFGMQDIAHQQLGNICDSDGAA